MAPRLPTIGGDNNNWGEVLNEFLSVAHNTTGTIKQVSVEDFPASKITSGTIDSNRLPVLDFPSTDFTTISISGGKRVSLKETRIADLMQAAFVAYLQSLSGYTGNGSKVLADNMTWVTSGASSVPTPAAPTSGVVDDTNNTFGWTNSSGYTSPNQYEFTVNGGTSYTTATANPQTGIGNVARGVGQVGVRVKAVSGVSNASAPLFNTTAFTVTASNGEYALSATRAEPMPTDYSGWETNGVYIHQYDSSSPYAGGGMGGGDIIIENRNFYIASDIKIINAYMPYNVAARKVIVRNCTFVTSSKENIFHVTDDTWIEVRNCRAYCTLPFGVGRRRFLYGYKPKVAIVENCYFQDTGGIKIEHTCTNTTPGLIQIKNNKVRNIHRQGDNNGGEYQQFLQLQHIVERPNIEIAWNYVKNVPGASRVEDNINLGETSGTSGSPLLISHNLIDGAYPANPTESGFTGTGMTSDAVSSGASLIDLPHNIHATLNTFVRCMNSSMNIAAGYNILYDYNTIRTSAVLPDGTPTYSANNAVSLFRGQPYPPDKFFNNAIVNNDINGKPRAYYRDPDGYLPEGNTFNTYAITATYADEEAAVQAWIQSLETNQILVGVII